ncbi:TPA: hypothetical protein ACH3X1_006819 [Trebouxia sp. C0004]
MQTAKSTGLLRTELYSNSIWNMFGKSWACKTYDFVLLSGAVMMYALQDKLETRLREALSLLFEAISRVWSKMFQRSQLPKLQALLHKASHLLAGLAPVAWYLDQLGRLTVTLVRHKGSWTAQSGTPRQRQIAKTLLIQFHLLHLKDGQYGLLWNRFADKTQPRRRQWTKAQMFDAIYNGVWQKWAEDTNKSSAEIEDSPAGQPTLTAPYVGRVIVWMRHIPLWVLPDMPSWEMDRQSHMIADVSWFRYDGLQPELYNCPVVSKDFYDYQDGNFEFCDNIEPVGLSPAQLCTQQAFSSPGNTSRPSTRNTRAAAISIFLQTERTMLQNSSMISEPAPNIPKEIMEDYEAKKAKLKPFEAG